MDVAAFERSLAEPAPPAGMAPLVAAMWHDKRGEWNRAHEMASAVESTDAAWVHAYLHRREGDHSNAAYWYRQAGKPINRGSLDDEWRSIVAALLAA